MDTRIITCGNVAYDLISSGRDRQGGYSFEARPGGSVLNTSILLARLGMKVSVLAKCGADFLGDSLLEVMLAEKIDISRIARSRQIKTGLAFALVDRTGESSYLFYRPAGPHTALNLKHPVTSIFRRASVFHTGSAFSYQDHTFENSLRLMEKASGKGLLTTYDPNWREGRIKNKKRTRERIKKLLEHTGLLKLSETDALGITGSKTLSASLRHLPERTVVTLGARGSFFWDGRKRLFCPAIKVKVVDTIGAGDAFTAGLIYRYCLKGKGLFWDSMPDNLRFASAVSAIVCSGRGAVASLKSPGQAARRALSCGRAH